MTTEATTTVQVYAAEHRMLKDRQRRVSDERGQWVPMPDLIRELIQAADKAAEGA